jgi:urease accessory protein
MTTEGFVVRNLSPYRALVAAAAAIPAVAFAHTGHDAGHGLVQGFMHPLGGLDHVLAMIAVGVIAVQLGGRALWALPLSFVATMAIAGFAGMAGLMLPGLEAGIALSVIVLGAIISTRIRLSVIVAASMVAAFAIFHGYSHGLEMVNTRSGFAFGLGFVSATVLLHLTGIGLGLALGRIAVSSSRRIARAGGSALALTGVVLLAGSLS